MKGLGCFWECSILMWGFPRLLGVGPRVSKMIATDWGSVTSLLLGTGWVTRKTVFLYAEAIWYVFSGCLIPPKTNLTLLKKVVFDYW